MARRAQTPGPSGWYAYAPASTPDHVPRQAPAARRATIERPSNLNVLEVRSKGGVHVDGRSLASMVTEAERAAGEKRPGDYDWLPPSLRRAPSTHLLGEPEVDHGWGDDWERYGFEPGSVAVGGCGCGEVGCHPLVVVIELGNGLVRWRRFQSRASDDLDIGPFIFNERRYRTALGFSRT